MSDLGAAEPSIDLSGLDLTADLATPSGIVRNPAIRSRNGVLYLTATAWLRGWRSAGVALLKEEKRRLDPAFVDAVAADLAGLIGSVFGSGPMLTITNVACGHSRRPDCLSKRLARAVADRLGSRFEQVFEDRFVRGSSHPKENTRLPALVLRSVPAYFTVVVDDVATSGFHIEEAVRVLRERGVAAAGVAWCGGEVSDEGRDRWEPSPG